MAEGQPTLSEVSTAIGILQNYILANINRNGPSAFIQNVANNKTLTDTERVVLLYSATAMSHATNMLELIRSNSGVFGKALSKALSFLKGTLAGFDWLQWLSNIKLDPSITSGVTLDRLTAALGVPATSLNRAIISLAAKLSGKTSVDVDQPVRVPSKG